jgi:hypothetical protein
VAVCLYIFVVSLIRLVQMGSTRIDLFFKGREGKGYWEIGVLPLPLLCSCGYRACDKRTLGGYGEIARPLYFICRYVHGYNYMRWSNAQASSLAFVRRGVQLTYKSLCMCPGGTSAHALSSTSLSCWTSFNIPSTHYAAPWQGLTENEGHIGSV